MPSLFEHAGGEEALHRLEQVFYESVLADPLLQPLFGAGQPEHVDHLTAFTAESFGGSDRFSRELGFAQPALRGALSSSAPGWRCRTLTPRPTISCTHCARCPRWTWPGDDDGD